MYTLYSHLSQEAPSSPVLNPSVHAPVAVSHASLRQLSGLQPHTQLPLPR